MQHIFADMTQQRALRPDTGADARALYKESFFAIFLVPTEEVHG